MLGIQHKTGKIQKKQRKTVLIDHIFLKAAVICGYAIAFFLVTGQFLIKIFLLYNIDIVFLQESFLEKCSFQKIQTKFEAREKV